jgi:hypothetical protein
MAPSPISKAELTNKSVHTPAEESGVGAPDLGPVAARTAFAVAPTVGAIASRLGSLVDAVIRAFGFDIAAEAVAEEDVAVGRRLGKATPFVTDGQIWLNCVLGGGDPNPGV